MKAKLLKWVDERYDITGWIEFFKKKSVPVSSEFLWYYFGGVSLFLFIIQIITGILLLMYYNADPDRAYESIRFLMAEVDFGWLIRSLHSWSANLMVLAIFIHMFSVFFLRAYRPPRELTWVTGVFLLFLTLGFGFSGYLLPWNELAFFATKVGTDIAGSVPIIGDTILKLSRGGEDVTGATLSRFFGLHVAIMPFIFFIILSIHLLFVQVQGMSQPLSWETGQLRGKPVEMKRMPFFPNFALRDLLLWLIVLNILAILAVFFPWELGEKADSFAPAPAGIKPEWYFMFMFETLKFIPAHILFIEGEVFGIFMFGLAMVLWVFVPFLDTRVQRGRRNKRLIQGTKFWVIYIIYMTVFGYYQSLAGWFADLLKGMGLSQSNAEALYNGLLSFGVILRWISMLVAAVAGVILLLWTGSLIRRAILRVLKLRRIKPDGNISVVALFLLLPFSSELQAQTGAPSGLNQCMECHSGLDDELKAPTELLQNDIHFKSGLSCADCHGGDPSKEDGDTGMYEAENWLGAPTSKETSEFCGRCHSNPDYMRRFNPSLPVDQVEKYYTSYHGKALLNGDKNVATCVDCHMTHGIRKSSDTKSSTYPRNLPTTCNRCHGDELLMSQYGIASNQYEGYKSSVHGEALYVKGDMSSPVCNDCHGNHGAAPPGVEDIAFVCGLCHINNYELFNNSPMGMAFHDIELQGCEVCHGNHAISKPSEELLGLGEGAVCSECHEEDDDGGVIAVRMREMITELNENYNRALNVVHDAEQKGVEVSQAFFILKEAHQSYLQARTRIHSFNVDYVAEEVEKGNEAVSKAEGIGVAAIHEFSLRKRWLGFLTLVLTVLAIALWVKIKEIEKRQNND